MGRIIGANGQPLDQGKPEPQIPPEIEQWGQLVAWLRAKDYTPTMIRATVLDYEEREKECTGLESISKQQD
jgi:hypothetical protein